MKSKLFRMLASVLLLAGILFSSCTSTGAKHPTPIPGTHPVIFVHGGAGSGAQFESQAMRFESNGYPADYIAVHEYDSSYSINTMEDVWAGLDQLIDNLLEQTGADQVDIVGHSLGTVVMYGYLGSSPERAAKVAHYVNVDGMPAAAPPGGVLTLAIWAGRGAPDRQIVGATNVTVPDQTHVQSATSAESFVEMYKFFTGKDPATTDIVPEPASQVELAGRAVTFPQNQGATNATLEIWKVDGDTGGRIGKKAEAVYSLGADGAWGPFQAKGGQHYEFVVLREGLSTAHFYYEPFIRSDYLIRLNLDPPVDGVGSLMDTSDHQSNMLILRYREFWGDQGVEDDTLQVNGVNVVNAATSPLSKRVNGVFVYDKGADGASDLTAPIPAYFAITFLTGVDLFIPGATPPTGTTLVVLTPRGGGGKTQVINVPNWASSTERITVQFRDGLQED
jgi:pimeloyl-ACP methyl ester carboxylesterase